MSNSTAIRLSDDSLIRLIRIQAPELSGSSTSEICNAALTCLLGVLVQSQDSMPSMGSQAQSAVGPTTRFRAVDVKATRLSEARDLGFEKILSYAMDILESKPGEPVRLTELIPKKQSRSTYRDRLFAHWATNPCIDVTHEKKGNSTAVTTWVVLMTEDEGEDD